MDLSHDLAHQQTEKDLAKLERRVQKVYKEAQKDLQQKLDAFTRKFQERDKLQRQRYTKGEITEEQYKAWLRGQIFQGDQWKAKLDQITDTLVHADQVAQKIINGEVYGVFANNANWQSYNLEHGAGLNFGFELYDPATVERLLREQPNLLPKKKVDVPKDKRWSKAKITQQITQGIIQGESLDKIATRLQKVTTMNRNFALTNARTAMTGAQNAGRQESLTRAAGMGIKTKKEWLATLDHHTRTSHAKLDGQQVAVDKPFEVDGYRIRFPGDPQAHPAMVYNCRCTMIGALADYPDEIDTQRRDNIEGKPVRDMTYAEWQKAKGGKPVKKPVETVEKPKHVVDLPIKPKRPKMRDFENEEDYYAAKEQYQKEREAYEKKVDDWVAAQMPKKVLTMDELKAWASAHDFEIVGSLDGLDMRLVTSWTSRYEKLEKDFPQVPAMYRDHYHYKQAIQFRPDEMYAAAANGGIIFGGEMRNYEKDLRVWPNAMASGDHIRGTGTIESLFDHEYGHNVKHAIEKSHKNWYAVSREMDKDIMNSLYGKPGMSDYATTNADEMWAEGFAAWYGGEQTEFALEFEKLLKRWLK